MVEFCNDISVHPQISQVAPGNKREETSPATTLRCWVVTDGKVGMENQCLGLAEAMGLTPEVKRIRLREPWRALNPWLPIIGRRVFHADSAPFLPPWPDLIIASGRQSAGPALYARKRSRGRTFVVQIQDPGAPASKFDLVVVPRHDKLRGDNVLVTTGALHRVTPARLAEAAGAWAPRLDHLPRPRAAVLIGGDNGVYRLTPAVMDRLASDLAGLARDGWSLMVTPSRRTGAGNEARLRAALAGLPADIWDGTGDNPYFGYLGLADAVIVTSDSVNMVTEAAATGKPVHVVDLEGGSAKFAAFHAMMRETGVTRPFAGRIEDWDHPPLLETERVAAMVWERYRARD